MDDREKATIEAEARQEVAERGHHGPKLGRYLYAAEQHAIKENEEDVVPATDPRPPPGNVQA